MAIVESVVVFPRPETYRSDRPTKRGSDESDEQEALSDPKMQN